MTCMLVRTELGLDDIGGQLLFFFFVYHYIIAFLFFIFYPYESQIATKDWQIIRIGQFQIYFVNNSLFLNKLKK